MLKGFPLLKLSQLFLELDFFLIWIMNIGNYVLYRLQSLLKQINYDQNKIDLT